MLVWETEALSERLGLLYLNSYFSTFVSFVGRHVDDSGCFAGWKVAGRISIGLRI